MKGGGKINRRIFLLLIKFFFFPLATIVRKSVLIVFDECIHVIKIVQIKIVTASTNHRLVFKRSRNNYSNFINETVGGCCSWRESVVSIRAEDFKYRFTIKRGRLMLLSLLRARERFNFTEATAVLSMLLQLYQSNRIELNGRLRNNGVSIILYNTLLYSRDISYCSNRYRTQSCFLSLFFFSFFLD